MEYEPHLCQYTLYELFQSSASGKQNNGFVKGLVGIGHGHNIFRFMSPMGHPDRFRHTIKNRCGWMSPKSGTWFDHTAQIVYFSHFLDPWSRHKNATVGNAFNNGIRSQYGKGFAQCITETPSLSESIFSERRTPGISCPSEIFCRNILAAQVLVCACSALGQSSISSKSDAFMECLPQTDLFLRLVSSTYIITGSSPASPAYSLAPPAAGWHSRSARLSGR